MKKESTAPKTGAENFVDAMLKSATEKKEVKAQQRFDDVDVRNIDAVMNEIKKGKVRKL
jgi:hypothetical protein